MRSILVFAGERSELPNAGKLAEIVLGEERQREIEFLPTDPTKPISILFRINSATHENSDRKCIVVLGSQTPPEVTMTLARNGQDFWILEGLLAYRFREGKDIPVACQSLIR